VTWAVLESYGVDHQLVRLLISPTVFIADLERAMDKVKDGKEGISVHGIRINNLRFADDIDIIAEEESALERTVH